MSNKALVGIHWLSLIWIIIILVLSSISLYKTQQAQKADDPTNDLNIVKHVDIALVVFVSIILLPLLYWCYKQSKIGFAADMIDVVF